MQVHTKNNANASAVEVGSAGFASGLGNSYIELIIATQVLHLYDSMTLYNKE